VGGRRTIGCALHASAAYRCDMPLSISAFAFSRRAGRHPLDPRLGVLDPDFEFVLGQSSKILPFAGLRLRDAKLSKRRWITGCGQRLVFRRATAFMPLTFT
jgi:hypothetical protein